MQERTKQFSGFERLKNKIFGGEVPAGFAAQIRDQVLKSVDKYPTKDMIFATTPQTRISQFSEIDPLTGKERKTPLSNFYPTEIHYKGKVYPNVEAAFQAAKFLSYDTIPDAALGRVNEALAKEGLSPCTRETLEGIFTDFTIDPEQQPKIAKKVAGILGEREYNLLRKDWRDINLELMMNLLIQKFRQPSMVKYLLSTKGKILFEGNRWGDDFYGVSMDKMGNLLDGKNILGRSLMNIRGKLQSGELPRQQRFVTPGMRR